MTDTSSNTEIFLRTPGNRLAKTSALSSTFSLTHVVEAAVCNIDSHALQPLSRHRDGAARDTKRLLGLLSWSYAREVYSSAQIAACLAGSQLGELWEGGAPDCSEIRRFRAANRSVLQSCLLEALRFLAAQKVAEGVVTRINQAHLAAEASRRIVTAMFIDSIDLTNPLTEQELAGS